MKVLHLLHDTTVAMIKSLCDSDTDKMTVKFGADSEDLLMTWAKNHGVKTMLKIDCESVLCILILAIIHDLSLYTLPLIYFS